MELKYPSIEQLYKQLDILNYEITCSEKLHGSNVRVLIKNGTITVGSHNELVDMTNPSAHFGFVGWVLEHREMFLHANTLLSWDEIYIFGEIIGPKIQKGVHYCDEKQFWVFGLTTIDEIHGTRIWSYDEIKLTLGDIGFNIVPELFRGKTNGGLPFFDNLINQPSVVAKQNGLESIMEGVVIQPVTPTMNKWGRPLMAKHKNEKFKEVERGKGPGEQKEYTAHEHLIDNASAIFAATFVTEERINHCIDNAREKGEEVVNDMPDMKFLVRYVLADVCKECADALIFADNLIGDRKHINKSITKRVSTLYQKMTKEQFVTNQLELSKV